MSDVNRVTLLGTVDGHPELKVVRDRELLTFRIAVTQGRENAAHTSWFTVTAWGGLAKKYGPGLVPGARVFVDGALRVRSYEHDGQKRTATEVEARTLLVALTPPEQRQDRLPYGGQPPDGPGDDLEIPF